MNKILLINPWYNRFNDKIFNTASQIPLGLIIIQKIFRDNGILCDILDLNNYKYQINNINTYYDLITKFNFIEEYDICGITSFSNNFINAILMAKEIKKKYPQKIIFMGGSHASVIAEKIIERYKEIDFIARYEGEKFALYYSKYIKGQCDISEVPNIVYTYDGKIVCNKVVELIPENKIPLISPDFNIIGYDKEKLIGKTISIEGGRGCPFNCIFCSTKLYWQRKSRLKPINNIINEIECLGKSFNLRAFKIVHDLFTADKKYICTFSDRMNQLKYNWNCSARFDTLDEETLDYMYGSGCNDVFFGIETGNEKLQKKIKKNLDLKNLDTIISHCYKKNYTITLAFILGFPFDNYTTLNDTLMMILKYGRLNNVKISSGILTPEVGTEVYENFKEKIKFDEKYVNINYDYVSINKEVEMKLIKENYDIFSHFYYIPNPYFSIFSLDYLLKVIRYILSNYSNTFLNLISVESRNLVELLEYISGYRFSSFSYNELLKSLENFEENLNKIVTESKDYKLKQIFKYEVLTKRLKKQVLNEDEVLINLKTRINIMDKDNIFINKLNDKDKIYEIKLKLTNKITKKVEISINEIKGKRELEIENILEL